MSKALVSLCALILLFTITSSGLCTPASPDDALAAGKAHLEAQKELWKSKPSTDSSNIDGRIYSVSQVRELRDGGRLLAYILDLDPEGCIVVSSDTDIHPVIAFSFRGNFIMEDSPDNVFLHLLTRDMGNRLDAIPATSAALKADNNALWEKRLTQEGSQIQNVSSVQQWGPWVETTWHQIDPYNRYCPIDPVTGDRCVVGCVATAMSQVINYWKYPCYLEFSDADDYTAVNDFSGPLREIRIDDEHDILDFPAFPELNEMLSDIEYDGNVDEMAALCFACGVCVEMRYSSQGSGAWPSLSGKFKYASAEIKSGKEEGLYDIIKANMKNAQPALLAIYICVDGEYLSGHAIVADGFRTGWEGEPGDYYHLNFGWRYPYPAPIQDCWYLIPDGMPYGYNLLYNAIVNIRPPETAPPEISAIPDPQFMANAEPYRLDLNKYVRDPDNNDREMTWSCAGNTNIDVAIDPATHIAALTSPEWTGAETITFIATDPDGLTASTSTTVTVYPIRAISASYDVLKTTLQLEFSSPVKTDWICFDGIGMELGDDGLWDIQLSNSLGLRANETAPSRVVTMDINRSYAATVNLIFAGFVNHQKIDLMLQQGAFRDIYGNGNEAVAGTVPVQVVTDGFLIGTAGDVSGDGRVSAYDAALLLQASVMGPSVLPTYKAALKVSEMLEFYGKKCDVMTEIADISGDGCISSLDALVALKSSAGFPAMAPVLDDLSGTYHLETNRPDDQRMEIAVKLDDVRGACCADVVMDYDPQSLTVAEVSGTPSASGWLIEHSTDPAGKLKISLAGLDPPMDNSLLSISFDVTGNPKTLPSIADLMINGKRLSEQAQSPPERFALLQNYPNPFNPETWIPYRLPEAGNVTITVYNANGQIVRLLELGSQPPGYYTDKSKAAHWDGRNESGESVSSGIYFYQLQAGSESSVGKMIIAK